VSAPDTSSSGGPVDAGYDSSRQPGASLRPGDPVLTATTAVAFMGAEALRLELVDRLELTYGLLLHDSPRFDMVARELRAVADLAETDPEAALRRLVARVKEQLLARCADCDEEAA
jgi:hypothetical protein